VRLLPRQVSGSTGPRSPYRSLKVRLAVAVAASAFASGCSSGGPDPQWGVSASPRVIGPHDRIPKGGGVYKVGKPYVVGGRWYTPRPQPGYDAAGIASWYGDDFHGRKTSNGEIYDMRALTAAHPTLPLPSYAYVTSLENGRTILVRINDRGPYVGNRIIDLSRASAAALGLKGQGLGRVRVRYAGHAPLNGDDTRERRFLAQQPWSGAPRLATAPPPDVGPAVRGRTEWSVMQHRSGLGGEPR